MRDPGRGRQQYHALKSAAGLETLMQDWFWLVRFVGVVLLFLAGVAGVMMGAVWFLNWAAGRWSNGLHQMRVGYHQGRGRLAPGQDLPKHDWDKFERKTWWTPAAVAGLLVCIIMPPIAPFYIVMLFARIWFHTKHMKEKADAERACRPSEDAGRQSAG